MPLAQKLLGKIKMKSIVLSLIVSIILLACASKKDTISSNQSSNQTSNTNSSQVIVEGLNLGNKAPEIMQATPTGNVLTLGNYKGKMLLIDFWASWCAPCRAENPTVVTAYKKFKDKNFKSGNGFEILSVSLDQNAAAWAKAIQKDSLIWKGHVSDLQGWNNAAAIKYGVRSIPTNFLINGDGIIVAKGLRGSDLEKALNDQLK